MDRPTFSASPQLAAAVVAETLDPADAAIESAVWSLLDNLGEDPQRDGLLNTPKRVRKMYRELLSGYDTDPVALINNAIFDVDYSEMVVVKDIELQSLCEHHMLPFIGKAHVAYLPDGKVLGLLKIPRIVDMFARRLQVQERLTAQIADFLEDAIHPRGVAVVVEAAHMCAAMRGVRKADVRMVTQMPRGEFKSDAQLRQEFMQHISRASNQEVY
ncbi:MAG: GTP cyclohydrolase I FolE [Anaerolineales bacterium]